MQMQKVDHKTKPVFQKSEEEQKRGSPKRQSSKEEDVLKKLGLAPVWDTAMQHKYIPVAVLAKGG